MDRGEMRDEVRELVNIRSVAILSDEEINRMLQESYAKINDHWDWPFLEKTQTLTLVNGTPSYTLTYPGIVRGVYVDSGPYQSQVQLSLALPGATEGDYRYSVSGNQLTVLPTPSGAGSVRVVTLAFPPQLDSDNDEPWMDEVFQRSIVYLAASWILSNHGSQSPKKTEFAQLSADYVDRMYKYYVTSHTNAPVRMGAGITGPQLTGDRWGIALQ